MSQSRIMVMKSRNILYISFLALKNQEGGIIVAQVELNTNAPDFSLKSFEGETVQLSDFKGKMNVLLVLNRGFI